jgi:hypothetical protein
LSAEATGSFGFPISPACAARSAPTGSTSPAGVGSPRTADLSTVILKDDAEAQLDDDTRPLLALWPSHDSEVDEALAQYLGVPFSKGMRNDSVPASL